MTEACRAGASPPPLGQMRLQQTNAVVLEVTSHGESDKLVTLYGRQTGKIRGIAKGANRSRIRFVNKLEIFSLLTAGYKVGRSSSLVLIDQAELLKPFAAIRQEYLRYAAASLVGELVNRFCGESDPDPNLFDLLLWALDTIATEPEPTIPPPAVAIFFEIRLLDLLGYRPGLTGCRQCGTLDADERPYHFTLNQGGLLCNRCNAGRHSLIPISLATARLLAKALELAPAKLGRLRLTPAIIGEAQQFLMHYSRHLLQREINARACLLQLCENPESVPANGRYAGTRRYAPPAATPPASQPEF